MSIYGYLYNHVKKSLKIPKWLSESVNLRYRIPKGQSKKGNPEELATKGTQDE